MAQIAFKELKRATVVLFAALTVAAISGCIVEDRRVAPAPAGTRIAFEEVRNLGATCGGPLTGWTVWNRQTGDQGTAGCEQPIFFDSVVPGQTYSFDVVGYSGQKVCWQGACDVYVPGNGITIADCSGQIAHMCGL